jgi:3',5'-cyclic AMP phosphodiesterase CpdA
LALAVLSLSFMAGCTGDRPTRALPIRIGLLADSQITSPDSTPDCPYRSRSLDRLSERAIRPPALEHLAAEMLRIALRQFPPDLDVILYLGDGANSGGENEIEALFAALEDHRRKSQIPIFMVIGNHDYLGLDGFIDALLCRYPDDERADVVRCLAFITSASEVGACRGPKGFDPDRCRLR